MGVLKVKIISAVFLLAIWAVPLSAATTTSITQYGITWTFDASYEYGQFANGDYWVVGPITIESITPDFAAGRNGWQVNPSWAAMNVDYQGFDDRCGFYNATFVPSLPYAAQPGDSIVKMVSSTAVPGDSQQRTQTAAVLTVLAATPAGNGAGLFRPGYAGTEKTLYAVVDLHTEKLLSIATTDTGVSYATINTTFSKPQIQHGGGLSGRCIRPLDNMINSYQPYTAGKLNAAIAKLNSNDTVANKLESLIYIIQDGIDQYNAILTGQFWPSGGGHEPGHKLSVAFAAYILDNQGMKDAVADTFWYENKLIQNSLWGETSGTEIKYWEYLAQNTAGSGNQDYKDRCGQIDGGANLYRNYDAYQGIVGNILKGTANWLRYYPLMAEFWSDSEGLVEYAERWVSHGTKTLPDTVAPVDLRDAGKDRTTWEYYGITWGSDGSGGCIQGEGRWPEYDGLYADTGQYASTQMNEMWSLYAPAAPAVAGNQSFGSTSASGAGRKMGSTTASGSGVTVQ